MHKVDVRAKNDEKSDENPPKKGDKKESHHSSFN